MCAVELLESTFYEIAPKDKLPVFDPSFKVKQLLFHKRWLPRLNAFLRRHASVIVIAYVTGLVCRSLTVAVSSHTAKWVALASVPLQLPAILNVVFQFRVALVKSLVYTYDFWYFFVMNVVWAVCLASYLRDWRIAMVPLMWIDVQNATLLDSFLQAFRVVVSATWVWALFLVSLIGAISLDLVDNVHGDDAIFVTARRKITVKEMLLNTMATVVLLIGRILYRKRAALKIYHEGDTATKTIASITLTWPLKLQKCSLSTARNWKRPSRVIQHSARPQLHLTLHCAPIQASDVLFPIALTHLRYVRVVQWVIRFVGVGGLVTTPVVFCLDHDSEYRTGMGVAAFTCTIAYISVVVSFYQRRLLSLLVVSFDFAFISLQLTTVHLCVADAFRWEAAPTLGILSCWLWLHLMMTIDALTPVMRRTIGFHAWFQVPVLLLTQASVVLLWMELSVWDSQGLYNRCFLRIDVGPRELTLHVVPYLMSRLLTVTLWASRILFRIATRQSDHDLLSIRSHVEFDTLARPHKRATFRIAPLSSQSDADPVAS